MSIFWEVILSVILRKIKSFYKYMCPIPNVFREIELSHRNFQIVDKDILGIVSNIGIYSSSEKFVQFT
jgi:hypothetical protein